MLLQDVLIAIFGGLTGTTVMTGMMLVGQRLGLPAIDVHGILGHITHPDRRTAVGYVAHWVLGALFAMLYVIIFRAILGNVILWGALLGIIHWLLVGGFFAFAPLVHAGMKAGTIKEPGAYMVKSLGTVGFFGGLMGHIVFGLTIAIVYGWFA